MYFGRCVQTFQRNLLPTGDGLTIDTARYPEISLTFVAYSPALKKRIHKHTIRCHITDKYNDIFSISTCNFSKEHYVFPEDDLRIET